MIDIKDKSQMVEAWGDIVQIKSLLVSIIISIITTMGAYFMANPDDGLQQLLFGLGGAILGFSISSLLIKPKRIIFTEEERDKK